MIFHHDLWPIAAATAPVVALAAIVSLTDALKENADSVGEGVRMQQEAVAEHYDGVDEAIRAGGDIQAAQDKPMPPNDALGKELIKYSGRLTARLFGIGVFNLAVQAFVLTASLVSVVHSGDFVSPWLAVGFAVGGLLLLLVSALGAFSLRLTRTQKLREEQDNKRDAQAARSAEQAKGPTPSAAAPSR